MACVLLTTSSSCCCVIVANPRLLLTTWPSGPQGDFLGRTHCNTTSLAPANTRHLAPGQISPLGTSQLVHAPAACGRSPPNGPGPAGHVPPGPQPLPPQGCLRARAVGRGPRPAGSDAAGAAATLHRRCVLCCPPVWACCCFGCMCDMLPPVQWNGKSLVLVLAVHSMSPAFVLMLSGVARGTRHQPAPRQAAGHLQGHHGAGTRLQGQQPQVPGGWGWGVCADGRRSQAHQAGLEHLWLCCSLS